MLSQEIRKKFLNYFKNQGHTIVPSSSLIPENDPTILFTNAGMNQFKDVFLGKSKRDFLAATSSQKCIRVGGKHNDLENVGHTSRHLTFFEMLGNFSFGNYFKKEAIGFALDVTCHVFDFDIKKIWVSIYKDDEEAFEIWKKHISPNKIVRFGEKENFWAMGDTGPCGPCSELLYDRGEEYSNAGSPLEDITEERYLEFWNLVFMQYDRKEDGSLKDLPKPCIDTGAGLERILSLKIKKDLIFATDLFMPIIREIEKISNIKYEASNKETAASFHVIADHIRTLSFAIADGAIPSNTDRGYVLRKILRRAVRYARKINIKKPFLAKLLPSLINTFQSAYIELKSFQTNIEEILTIEEENFIRTLNKGGNILNEIIKNSKKTISGKDAFKLKDTYGFPIEEILLIAKDALLNVDIKTFEKLEIEAKEKSKKAYKKINISFNKNIFEDFSKVHTSTQFVGYDTFEISCKIIALLKEDKFKDQIEENDSAIIILDKTPFYPEMGGQVGDIGTISFNNNIFEITNTISPYPNIIAHIGIVKKGIFKKNDTVQAKIDYNRRKKIENNHSATHLLHFALRKVLNESACQKGSSVDDKRIRFDFNYHKPLTIFEIRDIEKIVNEKIRENKKVSFYEIDFEEAKKDKEIQMLFTEKYQKKVRVIDMQVCKELCGGCHSSFLGNIGLFKIKSDTGIAKGIRRIEAVTGLEAEKLVFESEDFILAISTILNNTPKSKIFEKIDLILQENKDFKQKFKKIRKKELEEIKKEVLKTKEKIGPFSFIAKKVDLTPLEITAFIKELSLKTDPSIITLATVLKDRCQIIIKVSNEAIEKNNILANHLIKEISSIIEGKGGGKMDLAQAGGKKIENIELAFKKIREIVKNKCLQQ